jgi:hypothetical protein
LSHALLPALSYAKGKLAYDRNGCWRQTVALCGELPVRPG